MSKNIIQRFMKHVRIDPITECWEWIGSKDRDGYGIFFLNSKPVFAHRFSYIHFYGSFPDGLVTDHVCRNRCCVNPLHLDAVTVEENNRRALPFYGNGKLGTPRTKCKHGHDLSGDNVLVHHDRTKRGTVRQRVRCKLCEHSRDKNRYRTKKSI